MDEPARELLADLGLAGFVDKLESLGVLGLPDIGVLLHAGLAELGMTRVQIRRLQQATLHEELPPPSVPPVMLDGAPPITIGMPQPPDGDVQALGVENAGMPKHDVGSRGGES